MPVQYDISQIIYQISTLRSRQLVQQQTVKRINGYTIVPVSLDVRFTNFETGKHKSLEHDR